jgi:replicative DNA helicase
MTYPDFVLRAEQAVIGAALRDSRLLEDIAYLTPDRMAHPTHRAILSALIESRTNDPTASPTQLPERIAEYTAIPGVNAGYLQRLADSVPEPRNIAAYARLVQEAAVRRDLARHVDRFRSAEAGLDGPDPELARVTQAIRRTEPAIPVSKLDEPAPTPYESRTRADVRLNRYDSVLAALIQQPEQVREISIWLYPEVFEGERREVYEAVVAVAERSEPVDQLTVAWEIHRRDPQPYEVVVEADAEERPALLTRLATAVVTGAAVELAGQLLAEGIRTKLATDFGQTDVTKLAPARTPAPRPNVAGPSATPQADPAPLLQPPTSQQSPTAHPNIRP